MALLWTRKVLCRLSGPRPEVLQIIVREIGVVKVILWIFFEIILFFRSFLHCGFFILEIIISSGSSGAGGMLAKMTAFMAVVFVVTSLSYTYVTSSRPSDESAVLKVEPLTIEDVPAAAAPEAAAPAQPAATSEAPAAAPAAAAPADAPEAPAASEAPAAEAPAADAPAAQPAQQ